MTGSTRWPGWSRQARSARPQTLAGLRPGHLQAARQPSAEGAGASACHLETSAASWDSESRLRRSSAWWAPAGWSVPMQGPRRIVGCRQARITCSQPEPAGRQAGRPPHALTVIGVQQELRSSSPEAAGRARPEPMSCPQRCWSRVSGQPCVRKQTCGCVQAKFWAISLQRRRSNTARATRLDHVAVSTAPWQLIVSVSVGAQLGSDHWPLQLRAQADAFFMVQPEPSGTVRKRRVWRSDARGSYMAGLGSEGVQDRIQRCVAQAAEVQVEEAIAQLRSAIGVAADFAVLRKCVGWMQPGRQGGPYLDAQCLALKAQIRRPWRRGDSVRELRIS